MTLNFEISNSDHASLLVGGGEMGERIRAFDWSENLGPITHWPQSLITAVNIVLQSPVPLVMLWGRDGIMLYNDAYSIFAGGRHPFLLGSKVVEGWPEVADFNQNVMDTGLRGETLSYKDQQLILYRHGVAEEVWMDLDYSPIIDESGKPAGVLAVVTESTQRVLAEQKQKEAENRLQLALNAAGMIGIWDWDITTDKVFSDPRFAAMFSIEQKMAEQGVPLSAYLAGIHPDDVAWVGEAVERSLATGEKFLQEYRLLQKEGVVRWIVASGQCFYDDDNKPKRFTGTAVDITDRKQAEKTLTESEERFRQMTNLLPIVIWTASPDGNLTWISDQWIDFSGKPLEESLGTGWTKSLHPDDCAHAIAVWTHSLKTEDDYEVEFRVRHKSGEYRWALARAVPIRDAHGVISSWYGTNTDIEDKKVTEEKLKEAKVTAELANIRKSQALANMSHELRTPLNAVIGYSEMLINGMAQTPEKQAKYASNISASGKHLLNMINDILDMAKVESGKIQFKLEPIPIQESVTELIEFVSFDAEKKNIQITVNLPSDIGYGVWDAARFRQIILNLLTNAIKYNKQNGSVWLTMSKSDNGEWVYGEVKDTGIGIPQNQLENIFSEFFRVSAAVQTHQGTGLGLTLTKSLIEHLGGSISVESVEGVGSTFKFQLPTDSTSFVSNIVNS